MQETPKMNPKVLITSIEAVNRSKFIISLLTSADASHGSLFINISHTLTSHLPQSERQNPQMTVLECHH